MPFLLMIYMISSLGAEPAKVDFNRDIQPIFKSHCHKCHGEASSKNGLRLDRKVDALKGGDSGRVIIPGKADASILYRNVSTTDNSNAMPPKGPRLSSQQLDLIKNWINQGAQWPDDGSEKSNALSWWSLQPMKVASPPLADPSWIKNPIDSFIWDKLQQRKLRPSKEASRIALLRRVYFDVMGLPPEPSEIENFLNDKSPDAYEKLVDRLLASPHYGERWARHWLDAVHFGETHGYDKDKLRPNAWPYRDYVIRSFNADKPYGRFVSEQLAGDMLFPDNPEGIEALGFIASGPWDFIGHAEVPESKIDGKVARHLDRDDMVSNTANTFLSMTVQCAQCHNHKFDPITQADYYGMQAVFAALDRADKPYHADPTVASLLESLKQKIKVQESSIREFEAKMPGSKEAAEIDSRLSQLQKASVGKNPAFGYHSGISPRQVATKWVQVELPQSQPIDRIVLHACHDEYNNIGAGFGFPVRYQVQISDEPTFKRPEILNSSSDDIDQANPGLIPVGVNAGMKKSRYVRVVATKLAPRQGDYIFALAELEVLGANGKNLALNAPVTSFDSIEAPSRWTKKNLTDGIWFEGVETSKKEIASLQEKKNKLLNELVPEADKLALQNMKVQLSGLKAQLAKLPQPKMVFAGTVHTGSGAFSGTGATGGKPRVIHLLQRGNIEKPLDVAQPGAITSLPHSPGNFSLPENAPEGLRRVALADWITHDANPLVWRSIVNRVWRWHFGRGIVDTPNDFGRMGKEPSHPELLDWLASDFRDNGHSLKRLHRLILTSATYQQSSANDPEMASKDSDNVYYWRMNRRKLEAEAIRDSVLKVSGKLDETMFGPSFQDFVIQKPEHSPHYQYHLHNPEDPKAFRRAVYRFLVRSQQQPFMTTLDCADPSLLVDKRNESLSALQALVLLNNGFMLVQSKAFAERLERDIPKDQRVEQAFFTALGRRPTASELETLTALAKQHSLADLARVLFNLNEFSFVD